MAALDARMPRYEVNEVHAITLTVPPETALERALALPVGSDRLVRALLRLRGLRSDLPIERFVTEVLGLEPVERTPTRFVGAGRTHTIRLGVAFEAEPQTRGGARLVTETRVAGAGARFRLYWLVVGPFSALIRRRWLRAVARQT